MERIALIVGRVLLALLFVLAGASKLADISGTSAYIEEASVLPGILAAPTGLFEVAAGILLAIGRWQKWVALALGVFTLATIAFFHTDFSQQIEITLALKNLAIAGGLFVLFAVAERPAS